MIVPTSTSPKCQRAAEYHLFVIFAVLDVSLVVSLCILYGVEICHLPLTWPVAVNTVLALPRSLWLLLINKFLQKLTARHTSKTAKITKIGLPRSTSPKCQCAAEYHHLFVMFAILDVPRTVNLCRNCSFLHLYLPFCYVFVAVAPGLPSRITRLDQT